MTLKELAEQVPREDWGTCDIFVILHTPMRGVVRRLDVEFVHLFPEPTGHSLELTINSRWEQTNEES